MSDRIAEIRARLDEWQSVDLNEHERRGVHAYEGMAADIAWLLDEVEQAYADIDEAIRKGEDAADYYEQQFEAMRRRSTNA